MKNSIHATDQPLNRALGISWAKPKTSTDLRKLFFEMNIGYQIQRRWPTNDEVGFYCIATSYLRKDSAMERITEFVNKHLMPYEVIDGEGLTFYVHDQLN